MQRLVRQPVKSGESVLDGFELNGAFVRTDSIKPYMAWEFRGHEEYTASNVSFITEVGYDIELVSLMGGPDINNPTPVQLFSMQARYKPMETPSQYPDVYVFNSNFGQPILPFSFPSGIIIPGGCHVVIALNSGCAYMRLIAVPVLPTLIGAFTIYP